MEYNYRILGLTPDADIQQVKEAYRRLAAEHNPDRYTDPNEKHMAQLRLDEINRAFDEIMNYLRVGTVSQQSANPDRDEFYVYIRRLIQQGQYNTAINQLTAYNNEDEAEWQFLMGSALYYGGYISQSYPYFRTAAQMDPYNREYTATYNRMNQNRSGNIYQSPYSQQTTYQYGGFCCDPCTVCQCMICMDCCCH